MQLNDLPWPAQEKFASLEMVEFALERKYKELGLHETSREEFKVHWDEAQDVIKHQWNMWPAVAQKAFIEETIEELSRFVEELKTLL